MLSWVLNCNWNIKLFHQIGTKKKSFSHEALVKYSLICYAFLKSSGGGLEMWDHRNAALFWITVFGVYTVEVLKVHSLVL